MYVTLSHAVDSLVAWGLVIDLNHSQFGASSSSVGGTEGSDLGWVGIVASDNPQWAFYTAAAPAVSGRNTGLVVSHFWLVRPLRISIFY